MSISSAPSRNAVSSAPARRISFMPRPGPVGTKPMSNAPTRAAAVCSTQKPFQSSLTAPISSASLAASAATAAPSGRASAPWPMMIIGHGALARPDGAAVAALAARLALDIGAVKEDWNGFCVLHTAAARVGAFDIGFGPTGPGRGMKEMRRAGALETAFLLGADEIDIAPGAFVVYIGTH